MVSDVAADVSLRCFGEAQKIGGTGARELGVPVNKVDQLDAQREVCKLKKQPVDGG